MATHKLGFLKLNTSEDGLAFRIGDGKIHRIGLGKKREAAAAGAYDADAYLDEADYGDAGFDAYDAGEAARSNGYTGRFASDGSGSGYGDYADADYADEGYADDYADDDYADDGYADDYADDGYADDDYADDGYADDGYGGDYYADDDYADSGYDDRYLDEDAGNYDDGQGYGSENPVLRYIDENDWVTYALLVLLPPLGIYLLWRRRRFDTPIRYAISAASGIWFIVMMILLISLILSGGGDVTAGQTLAMITPTPTIEPAVTVTPEPTSSLLQDAMNGGAGAVLGNSASATDGITPAQTLDALAPDASPSATPLAGYNVSAVSTGTVLVTATGPYYHNNASCQNLEQGVATSNLTEDVALQRGKVPCPICYPGQEIYYATEGGQYYHLDQNCSNMKNATPITREAATKRGQTACPVCVQHTVQSITGEDLRFVGANDKDQSGINVWATKGGQYYHTQQNCSGMTGAQSVGLLAAIRAGKTACPTCAAAASRKVWCTKGGKMFHNKSDCSNMQGAFEVTLAEALILNKTKCTTCWGNNQIGFTGNGVAVTANGFDTSGTVYVYATKDGQYYHTNATCSGMQNAERVTLASMLKEGRKACPTCAASAETTVYATKTGDYYHSYATCSGMTNAVAGTMAQAMALGKQQCPVCWQTAANNNNNANATGNGVYVYATQTGTYYHTNANCSGMQNAVRVKLARAVKYNKKPCPVCASAANRTVYSTDTGTYYHAKADCSDMKGAKQRTLQDALILGQSACPICLGNGANQNANAGTVTNVQAHKISATNKVSNVQTGKIQSSKKYTAGASGIKVYATANGKYYHGYKQHAGANAKRVSIETALNYGKTACPTCLKAARTTVYAVKGGRYYHRSKSCAGTGAASGKLATALARGLDACPVCVTRTQKVTNSNTFKSGASGIKVYATMSGKYFHGDKSCAGAGASYITLETALNYGKTPCPNCAHAAANTVYTSGSDKYYHISKNHAGAGASSGYWAIALAMGKKACPVCFGGSEAYEESDVHYSAPGDTRVYIDTNKTRFYYHKSARCGDGGLTNGTSVALDFAIKWGFKACPYCNPPTSVK